MSSGSTNRDSHKDPDTLEREVDEARARLGRTVDALGNRLSPGELLDQFLGQAREHGGEFASNLGRQVKQNPVPLLLAGAGVVWMLAADSNASRAHHYGSDSSDRKAADSDEFASNQVREQVRNEGNEQGVGTELAQGVRKGFANTRDQARNKADYLGEQMADMKANAGQSAQKISSSVQNFFTEQPLLAGALGVLIGASLAAVLPPTESEDNFFGKSSDQLSAKATEEVEKQYHEVGSVVKETVSEIEEQLVKKAENVTT